MHTKNTPQPPRQTTPHCKGLGNIFQFKEPKKQASKAILIVNKIDFKLKSIKRHKKGHFILVTEKNPSRGNLSTEQGHPHM